MMPDFVFTSRPGPARRCSACPFCGRDAMRQYGAKHHGHVSRYFYRCKDCDHINVWRTLDTRAGHWERDPMPHDDTANHAETHRVQPTYETSRRHNRSVNAVANATLDKTEVTKRTQTKGLPTSQTVCQPWLLANRESRATTTLPSFKQNVSESHALAHKAKKQYPMHETHNRYPAYENQNHTLACNRKRTCNTCVRFVAADGTCRLPLALRQAILEQFGMPIADSDVLVNTQWTHCCFGWEEAEEHVQWKMIWNDRQSE